VANEGGSLLVVVRENRLVAVEQIGISESQKAGGASQRFGAGVGDDIGKPRAALDKVHFGLSDKTKGVAINLVVKPRISGEVKLGKSFEMMCSKMEDPKQNLTNLLMA